MNLYRFCKRFFGIPLYSIFFKRVPFLFFYRANKEWMMYTRGEHIPVKEPKLTAVEYYRHFIPSKGGIVFDVGGERGLEARQCSKIVGETGFVYTFECFPEHIETLNTLSNKLGNVKVVERACWNETTDLTFFLGNTAGSHTAIPDAKGQMDQNLANQTSEKLLVKADTLDNLWSEYTNSSTVDFLKMDIEGAEYEAIEGGKKMLASTKSVVIAAYHIRDGIPTAGRVADMLSDLGFEVRVDENYHVYGTRNDR